jgi:stage IV sporulation protein FB
VSSGAEQAFAHANPRASAAMGIDDMQIPMVDRLAALNLFLAHLRLPMDGGRVLRAALESRIGFVGATERGVDRPVYGLRARLYRSLPQSDPRLRCRVYLAAASKAHSVALRTGSRGVPVSHAMTRDFRHAAA